MEEICYKTNPIKEAIAKVDFLSPIIQLEKEIPKIIVEKIKENFPIAENKELIARKLQISNTGVKQSDSKLMEWNFYNKERTKRLCITSNNAFITQMQYTTYQIFHDNFMRMFDSLCETFPELQIKRFGIRYINQISISSGNPLSWKTYLNKKLLSIFEVPKDKLFISRALHNLEFNYGDYNLRFQYGMHNPDYPATIKKKVFILDLDAYYSGLMNKNDIIEYFPKFHKSIQELFENSITEKYRELINKNG